MNPEAIQAGVTIIVPAGADATRTHAYRLRITEIYLHPLKARSGYAHLCGEVQRMDGSPSRRGRWDPVHDTHAPYLRYAILDPAKIYEAEGATQP